MPTFNRAYNTFVILTLAVSLAALLAGAIAYFVEDGDWPLFLIAAIGVGVLVPAAFLAGWAVDRTCRRMGRSDNSSDDDT